MSHRRKLKLFLRKVWLQGFSIYLPNLTMKALIIVIIQLFVLKHPIFKLLKLKFTSFYIYVITFEDANSKLSYQIMNIGGNDLNIILSHFYFKGGAFGVTFFT